MKCPVCNVEARVKMLPQAILKGGKYYNKMIFECRNRNCDKYEKEIGTQYIEFEVQEEE